MGLFVISVSVIPVGFSGENLSSVPRWMNCTQGVRMSSPGQETTTAAPVHIVLCKARRYLIVRGRSPLSFSRDGLSSKSFRWYALAWGHGFHEIVGKCMGVTYNSTSLPCR